MKTTTKKILSAIMTFVLTLTIMGVYSIPVQAATVAVGTARGTQGYDYVSVELTTGDFSSNDAAVKNTANWTLNASGGQTIVSIQKNDSKYLVLTLSSVMGQGDTFQLQATTDVFEVGTDPFATLDVNVIVPIPAAGTATAKAGTKDIAITLSSGTFTPSASTVQMVGLWTLGGASAAANPITSVTYTDAATTRSHVIITLTNDINIGETYVISASQGVFVNIAVAPFASPLSVAIAPAPDTTSPTATSISPADGVTNVPVSGNIVITFSEAMNKTKRTVSLTGGSSTMNDSNNWSTDDKTFTVSYDGLDHSTQYTVIFEFFEDIAGNALGIKSYSFITEADGGGGNICEVVDGAQYLTLDAALAAVPDSGTIKLLTDIVYGGGISLIGKSITFNLNGFTLNVENTGDTGLSVTNGNVALTGSGEFNVSGKYYGVKVDGTSQVTVTNATSLGTTDDSYGAWVSGGGKLTVRGDAKGTEGGAYATGASSHIAIGGNAIATAPKPYDSFGAYAAGGGVIAITGDAISIDRGIYAISPNSKVTVQNVISTGNGFYGVQVENMAQVFILGDCTVTGAETGIFVSSRGEVTVDGIISTPDIYIKIYPDEKDGSPASRTIPTTKTGYYTYSTANGVVWVKATSITDAEVVAADKAALIFDSIKNTNSAENNIIADLVTLPLIGANGSTISWLSTSLATISDTGVVVRPANGGGDVTVTLTATISKGGASDTVVFNLTVKELPAGITDQDKVAADKALLSFESIKGTNTAENNINANLAELPQLGANGSSLTWSSSGPTTISNTGTVTRPVNGSGDATVILTATITSGAVNDTVTFVLTVKELPYSGGGGNVGGSTTTTTTTTTQKINVNGVDLDPSNIDTGKPSYTIEIKGADIKNNTAYVSFPTSILTSFQSKNATFFIEIKTPYGFYKVPAELTALIPGLTDLLAKSNLKAEDVSLKITLTDMSNDIAITDAFKNGLPKGKVLGAIVDFVVEIINTKTGLVISEADSFTKAIARIIPMPKDLQAMPEYFSAFRYNETSKKFEFAPHLYAEIDGLWYVTILSKTNSVYVVADNKVTFSDVKNGAWYTPYVMKAAAKGLVSGVGNNLYQAEQDVTRAEFVQMIVNAIQLPPAKADTQAYGDVAKESWYYTAIVKAKSAGLLNKFTDANFNPTQPITREEMATILAAVLSRYNALSIKEAVSISEIFTDQSAMDEAYLTDIELVYRTTLMSGIGGGKFDPKGVTTRAQAATVQIRLLEILRMINK